MAATVRVADVELSTASTSGAAALASPAALTGAAVLVQPAGVALASPAVLGAAPIAAVVRIADVEFSTTTQQSAATLASPVALGAASVGNTAAGASLQSPVNLFAPLGTAQVRIADIEFSTSGQSGVAAALNSPVTLGGFYVGTGAPGVTMASPVTLVAVAGGGLLTVRVSSFVMMATNGDVVWSGTGWANEIAQVGLASPVALGAAVTSQHNVSSAAANLASPVGLLAQGIVVVPPTPLAVVLASPVALAAGTGLTSPSSLLLETPVALFATAISEGGGGTGTPNFTLSMWNGAQEVALEIVGIWDGADVNDLTLTMLV